MHGCNEISLATSVTIESIARNDLAVAVTTGQIVDHINLLLINNLLQFPFGYCYVEFTYNTDRLLDNAQSKLVGLEAYN